MTFTFKSSNKIDIYELDYYNGNENVFNVTNLDYSIKGDILGIDTSSGTYEDNDGFSNDDLGVVFYYILEKTSSYLTLVAIYDCVDGFDFDSAESELEQILPYIDEMIADGDDATFTLYKQ